MYSQLTQKKKQKKVALARKRGVIWSAQEQHKKSLRNTASQVQLSTTTTHTLPEHQEVEIIFPALSEVDYGSNHPHTHSHSDSTVTALTSALQDFKEQCQQLDFCIQVLTRTLQQLLNTKPPAKHHHEC